MDPHLHEWLHVLLRWIHIVAGIMWIGDSFLFMWLERTLTPPDPPRDGVTGELFMVHGGGYYQVEKRLFQPGKMPPVLHWFKWEATTTWVSGLVLLAVVYYLGGGALLVDHSVFAISAGKAMALGLGLLPVCWFVYDAIWTSRIGRSTALAGAVSTVVLGGLVYGLTHILSARAAFMHVGAVLGTLMVFNVWVRILPAQRRMLAAVRRGETVDPAPGKAAKKRSTHNTYMTLPVVFVMISNHFPTTYGSRWNWLVLLLLALAGAAVRHVMLERTLRTAWLLGVAGVAVLAVIMLTSPDGVRAFGDFGDEGDDPTSRGAVREDRGQAAAPPAPNPSAKALVPIDPRTVGSIRGTVRFAGPAPALETVSLTSECATMHNEPVNVGRTLVRDGRIKDALVFIASGTSGWQTPSPLGDVALDQRGCVYSPHVVGVRVGQGVAITNSDPLLHNIHAVARANDGFNLSMIARGPTIMKTFLRPEIVQMKCDVHPWMGARVGVFDHPWFAITDDRGAFALEAVPPGNYTVTAWHEELGEKTASASVMPRTAVEVEFAFSAH